MISCKKNGKVGSINYVLIEEYEDGEETKEIRVKKEKKKTNFPRISKDSINLFLFYIRIFWKKIDQLLLMQNTHIYIWNPSKPILIKQLRIISQSQIIRLISLCVLDDRIF